LAQEISGTVGVIAILLVTVHLEGKQPGSNPEAEGPNVAARFREHCTDEGPVGATRSYQQ